MSYHVARCRDRRVIQQLQRRFAKLEDLPVFDFDERDWWVAWKGDKPVGYAGMRIFGKYGWFSICAVEPAHRRKGLQKRLLTARVRHSRKSGLSVVYTYTINGNHASARALISRGFRPTTPPDRHYGCWAGEEDVLYWGLKM